MTVKELIEVLDEELESKEIYIFDDDKEKWVPLNKKDLKKIFADYVNDWRNDESVKTRSNNFVI